jgi:hypothetical protein
VEITRNNGVRRIAETDLVFHLGKRGEAWVILEKRVD